VGRLYVEQPHGLLRTHFGERQHAIGCPGDKLTQGVPFSQPPSGCSPNEDRRAPLEPRLAANLMKHSTLRLWSSAAILAAILAFPLLGKVDVDKLKPQGYLSDFAGVVDGASRAEIEAYCSHVDQALSIQIGVVTIPTIEDEPIEDFGIRMARHFQPGDAKTNMGALMILVIQDHKSDIEIGRGLEAYVNDGFAGGVLRGMRPQLRAGSYGPAILTGLHQMATEIARGKGIAFEDVPPTPERRQPSGRRGGGIPFGLIVFGFFVLVWLLGLGSRGGRGGGAGSFLTGMFLGSLFGGGRGSSGWGGGGGFGGSGGGGGGFGGFGGGGFGGGGANSDW